MRAVRSSWGVALAVLAFASGCSGDGEPTCADIADETIVVLQETIDIVGGFSEEEMTDFMTGGPMTAFDEVQQRGDDLVAAADETGCGNEEIRQLLIARSEELVTDTEFGRFVLETLLDGAFFTGG